MVPFPETGLHGGDAGGVLGEGGRASQTGFYPGAEEVGLGPEEGEREHDWDYDYPAELHDEVEEMEWGTRMVIGGT